MRLWQRLNSRKPIWWKYYPNVGCAGHKHRLKNLFDKWYDYPKAAHKLYWRLHPEEIFWDTNVWKKK